jgi:hypothetical protein
VKGEERMDKDDIKKLNKIVRQVYFIGECVLFTVFVFVAFEECKGGIYADCGLIGVVVFGMILAYYVFKECKNFYYEKRLEEEIEKEEE